MQKRTFDERTALKIYYRVCKAVKFIHSKNLIHRDIKPENILLNKSGQIKLCDFGFCAPFGEDDKRNTMCGTKEYLPPEIIENKDQDDKADVWCLGVLLYELLHKRIPFDIKNFKIMLEDVKRKKFIIKEGLSEATRQILIKSLELDPMKRPTVGQILELSIFDSFKRTHEVSETPEPPPKKNSSQELHHLHARGTPEQSNACRMESENLKCKTMNEFSESDMAIKNVLQLSQQEKAFRDQSPVKLNPAMKRPVSQNIIINRNDFVENSRLEAPSDHNKQPLTINENDRTIKNNKTFRYPSPINFTANYSNTRISQPTDEDQRNKRPQLYPKKTDKPVLYSPSQVLDRRFNNISPNVKSNSNNLRQENGEQGFSTSQSLTLSQLKQFNINPSMVIHSQSDIHANTSMNFGKNKIPLTQKSMQITDHGNLSLFQSPENSNHHIINAFQIRPDPNIQSNNSYNNAIHSPNNNGEQSFVRRFDNSPIRVMNSLNSNINHLYIQESQTHHQGQTSFHRVNHPQSPVQINRNRPRTPEIVSCSLQNPNFKGDQIAGSRTYYNNLVNQNSEFERNNRSRTPTQRETSPNHGSFVLVSKNNAHNFSKEVVLEMNPFKDPSNQRVQSNHQVNNSPRLRSTTPTRPRYS
jgi:serine/threonine protein kinase